jgi:Integrase core domain
MEMESLDGATVSWFLVGDRDSKVTRALDAVFAAAGIQSINTPIQAPNANAYAQRWVRTVRQECLEWLLIWGRRRHLERVLDQYVRHDNHERPHQSLALCSPRSIAARAAPDAVTAAAALGAGIASAAWFTSTTRCSKPAGEMISRIRQRPSLAFQKHAEASACRRFAQRNRATSMRPADVALLTSCRVRGTGWIGSREGPAHRAPDERGGAGRPVGGRG